MESYGIPKEFHWIPLVSLRGTPRAILMNSQDSSPLEQDFSPRNGACANWSTGDGIGTAGLGQLCAGFRNPVIPEHPPVS